MESYSLHEMNEYLRRVVALNFSDALWVRCEIAQLNESRGHFFFHLVEKEEEIIAKANAIMWGMTHRRLLRNHGRKINKVLQEGLEVLVKLKVEYHELYGLRYFIEDIDASYTIGKLAMQKRVIVEAFKKEGLLGKNTLVDLPLVLQRIAIISSENAAGYQDYFKQLEVNPFGYVVENQLFTAAMQGANVEEEILFQLKKIARLEDKYDAVVIIRGGGARLDLMAFDNEKISRTVADFPIPVLTGIGHDIDESILDKVAHTALKTPTAVADFIINHNLFFENRLLQKGGELNLLVQEKLQEQFYHLQNLDQNVQWHKETTIQNALLKVTALENNISQTTRYFIEKEKKRVEHLEQLYQLLSPEETLKRGFSITSVDGKIVKSTKDISQKKSVEISTQLYDGIIKSKTK